MWLHSALYCTVCFFVLGTKNNIWELYCPIQIMKSGNVIDILSSWHTKLHNWLYTIPSTFPEGKYVQEIFLIFKYYKFYNFEWGVIELCTHMYNYFCGEWKWERIVLSWLIYSGYALYLYSGGIRFESRPSYQLSWDLFLSLSRQAGRQGSAGAVLLGLHTGGTNFEFWPVCFLRILVMSVGEHRYTNFQLNEWC